MHIPLSTVVSSWCYVSALDKAQDVPSRHARLPIHRARSPYQCLRHPTQTVPVGIILFTDIDLHLLEVLATVTMSFRGIEARPLVTDKKRKPLRNPWPQDTYDHENTNKNTNNQSIQTTTGLDYVGYLQLPHTRRLFLQGEVQTLSFDSLAVCRQQARA